MNCDGQTCNRASLRLPVTTVGSSARRVEGGARQRPAYADVKDQSQADRDRRELGRAAVDRGARLLGPHGYVPGALGLDDRQAQYKLDDHQAQYKEESCGSSCSRVD